MTPEQKAFYEYGKAVESFRGTIHKIRKYAIYEFGELYSRLTKSERKCLISTMDLAGQIHTVRQKRAACRAWVHPMRRRCSNCEHELTLYKGCALCHSEDWPIYWEPRKERGE